MSVKTLDEILNGGGTKAKPKAEPIELPDGEEDLGPCASSTLKSKWTTALTIKHPSGLWESFQYSGIDVRSTYEPTGFEVFFANADKKWQILVTGRNLEKVYMLVIQARLDWIKAADRDFAQDGEVIVTSIKVTEIKEEK